MTYLISVVLVVAATIFTLMGDSGVGVGAYVAAALLSAVAIFLLFRRARSDKERLFVTDAPLARAPQWDKPLPRTNQRPPEGIELPPVSIAHYDDLMAAEVLPGLETLSVEELQDVITRERHGMGRRAIINRAEILIDLTLGSGSAQRIMQTASARQATTYQQTPPAVEMNTPTLGEPATFPDDKSPKIGPDKSVADISEPTISDGSRSRSRRNDLGL